MDARLRSFAHAAPATGETLPRTPPSAPLAMPCQSLHNGDARVGCGDLGRLGAVMALAGAITAVVGLLTYRVFAANGLHWLEALSLLFVALNVFWVSSAAVTAGIGAAILAFADHTQSAEAPALLFRTKARVALLYPIYNEDFERVLANAFAGYGALGADASTFEVFFISDSNDPARVAQEDAEIGSLRRRHPGLPFFYRRRLHNHGRKAGNIADFVRRWGGRYDYMVVYDADSVMTPGALHALVLRMDANPRTAIIQTVPAIIGARSLYARMQQFALNAYGPIFGHGLAWWSGDGGNYWGHNAIVRVGAFAAFAGLPQLPGAAPFGGDILSHDFVEAALLRRAGWRIEIAPDIGGSFEQAPPTLLDAATRDRRWAQGNLQHLCVLGARGLDWRSRAHIGAGIMGYASSLLWLALFALGLAASSAELGAQSKLPAETFALALLTGLLVFAPKWLALGLWLIGKLPGWKRTPSFLAGLAWETLAAAFITPIMIVNQAIAIFEIVIGRDAGWRAQIRERGSLKLGPLLRLFAPYKMLAGVAIFCACLISPTAGLLTAPVTLSLLLAAFICHAMAKPGPQGDWLWPLADHSAHAGALSGAARVRAASAHITAPALDDAADSACLADAVRQSL